MKKKQKAGPYLIFPEGRKKAEFQIVKKNKTSTKIGLTIGNGQRQQLKKGGNDVLA